MMSGEQERAAPAGGGATYTNTSQHPDFWKNWADLISRSDKHGKENWEDNRGMLPEARLAPLSPDTLHAHQRGRQTGKSDDYYAKARAQLERSQGNFHERLEQYYNPHINRILGRIEKEGYRNFNENINPKIESHFIRSGIYGGSDHKKHGSRAMRDMIGEIEDRKHQAMANMWQQSAQMMNSDKAREMEGAAQMATLGGLHQASNLADVQALSHIGAQQQQQDQALRDLKQQDFLRQKDFPYHQLLQRLGILTASPTPSMTQMGLGMQANQPQMNNWGRAGDAGAGMLGVLMQLGLLGKR